MEPEKCDICGFLRGFSEEGAERCENCGALFDPQARDVEEGFQRGWEQAQRGETHPIDELWDGLK